MNTGETSALMGKLNEAVRGLSASNVAKSVVNQRFG